jgi:hypothetical protein
VTRFCLPTVKVRLDGAWQPVDFEKIVFNNSNDSISNALGEALTDDRGVASIKVPMAGLLLGEDSLWLFTSAFEGNEIAKGGEAELTVKRGGMLIAGEKQDSIYSVTISLVGQGAQKWPIAEAEVGLYLKRHFSDLKIGEGTTDENGEVTIEFAGDFRGDTQGNIILIGKAEEIEEYGSIAGYMRKPWGIPAKPEEAGITRELWSHSPPLWMVITFAVLMTMVWGNYLAIVYKLIQIRKNKTT